MPKSHEGYDPVAEHDIAYHQETLDHLDQRERRVLESWIKERNPALYALLKEVKASADR